MTKTGISPISVCRRLGTWSEKQILHSSFRSECRIYWRRGLVNLLLSTYTFIPFSFSRHCFAILLRRLGGSVTAKMIYSVPRENYSRRLRAFVWFQIEFSVHILLLHTSTRFFNQLFAYLRVAVKRIYSKFDAIKWKSVLVRPQYQTNIKYEIFS